LVAVFNVITIILVAMTLESMDKLNSI